MRTHPVRQTRKLFSLALVALVLSCVSRTTPEGRVGDSLAMVTPPTFALVSADPTRFHFSIVGDLHLAAGDAHRLNAIYASAAADGDEFIIFLGDVVDQGTRDQFEEFVATTASAGWTGKVFCVAGNHDIYNDGWDYYKELMGSSTYFFTAGNSKFIALDTGDATLGAPQVTWLREQLAVAHAGPVFLLSHYLPVIPGQPTYLKLASSVESLNLMSLATRSGVTAWLGAHYHSYINQTIDGVTYVVAGGGGGRRMAPYRGYFYVRVGVDGDDVSYELKPLN
jgi:hypothetical protein